MPAPPTDARPSPHAPDHLQVVWLKRDLRVTDHRPLCEAAGRGPVLPLYIVEPQVVNAPDFSARHWAFIRESLQALREALAARGQPLVVRQGDAVPTFQRLYEAAGAFTLWAHEETGNARTFARDVNVRRWARVHALPFHEIRQHGVFRGLEDRDTWSDRWTAHMADPPVAPPEALRPVPIRPGTIPTADNLGLTASYDTVQRGGAAAGERVLRSFLETRGRRYHKQLSSPNTAFDHCSRLSPHLAWGTVSLRSVLHATRKRQADVGRAAPWHRALAAFESRLHWHDHFIQKLESAPRIEHESFIPALDALRADAFNAAHYEAWTEGRTGYPLVDACMRALTATGYLNFRMRAMLVSFAAYDLWLDWRRFKDVLARRWTDYEPGIHFSQLQMQSGTTGINALRMYDPTKQAREHDPDGAFIRRWLPALAPVPTAYVHAPWLMPRSVQASCGCRIGRTYPAPIVRHETAVTQARQRIAAARKRPAVQQQAAEILERHGSRRGRRGKGASSTSNTPPDRQQTLDL
ncbi:FAD-binding domain-containing protein [Salisaeta longa]|uniref:FAD-binding domain-containing protein n=1 Tax=Salisaeta longa TaxID=503170 RepID=UPI0003B66230|nr:deoxyribodipyrimidine photo-lyase [Salisaeta longa]